MENMGTTPVETTKTVEELKDMDLSLLVTYCTNLIKTGTNKKDFEVAVEAMKPNTQMRGWDGARAKEVIRLLELKIKSL